MGKEAVGAYIRALREANKLGQQVFAASLDTSKSLLDLIEKGKIDTRGSLLIHILLQLHGSPVDLVELMANPDATPEDGRRLAEEWLKSGRISQMALSGEVATLAQALAQDPARYQKWLGYGERLLEEAKGTS